ncbi:unnamed protein product [Rangifer tarandus platyrhynchus]|uniref:Uncharacterized protein n=1 Tax=Rangifer tarandus platyrhynchus TaxID=3082113 RepID=A0ABN8Z0Z5_RANTA|nr:unnamed protein product [Rangifer tarandus platyrhynchus]
MLWEGRSGRAGLRRQPRQPPGRSALPWTRAGPGGLSAEDKQANPQHPGEQRGGCRGGLDRGAGTCDGESAAVRLWLLFKALKLARFPGASGCPRENSTIRTLEKDGLCGLAEDKELEEEGGWQPWAGTGGKGHSRIRGALHACHPLTDVMVSGGLGRGPLVAMCRAREGRP